MTSIIRTAALSALIALGLACGAQAQPPGPPPGADGHRGPRPMAGEMQAKMKAMHEARERQHAADLRTILRLRPDQDGALTAYLQSHRPPMGPDGRRGPPGEGAAPGAPLTTPQRLDAMARREAEHAAMRQKHVEGLKTLYAALSPEQRQVFDALQRMHGPGGGGDEGGRGGGWGHHRGFGDPMGGPPGDD